MSHESQGYYRLSQIIPHIIPVSRSSWWRGVKSGKFPKPLKLGARTTVWKKTDIHAIASKEG